MKLTLCSPKSRFLKPRATAASKTANNGLVTPDAQSNVIITTTVSSSAYTLTYVPPTLTGTPQISASTTDGWHLIPPIVPLPFAVPPVLPPPEAPQSPETPVEPGHDNGGDNGQNSQIKLPTVSTSGCLTSTVAFGIVNCTEILWVSSYQLHSSLSGCSTTSSVTSACSMTITPGVSTATIKPDAGMITSMSDSDTAYAPGPVIFDQSPPDNPNWIADIFARELDIVPPVDPPRGSLTCAAKNSSGSSFTFYNANVRVLYPLVPHITSLTQRYLKGNIIDFCGNGLKITGDGISKNYTQPNDGSVLEITAKYAVNDTCPAGGTTQWDQSRCKFLLDRPLLECEPNGNAIPSPPMYGKSCNHHSGSRDLV